MIFELEKFNKKTICEGTLSDALVTTVISENTLDLYLALLPVCVGAYNNFVVRSV